MTNLKKTFSVYTSGNPQPVIFSDFESAQKAMADFNGIIAVPLASLARGKNYYLLIKAKMDKVRLPLNMEYVFFLRFFLGFWNSLGAAEFFLLTFCFLKKNELNGLD